MELFIFSRLVICLIKIFYLIFFVYEIKAIEKNS